MPKVEIKATALTEITLSDLRWADEICFAHVTRRRSEPRGLHPMIVTADELSELGHFDDEVELSETLSALHTAAFYYELAVVQGYRSGTTEWPNVARSVHNALLDNNPEMVELFGFKKLPLL